MPRPSSLLALLSSLAACSGSERSESTAPAAKGQQAAEKRAEPSSSAGAISGSGSGSGSGSDSASGSASASASGSASDSASASASASASDSASASASPPSPSDFVDVTTIIPDAVLDLRYATEHNFTKKKLYPAARCLLRRAVAERLSRAADLLRRQDRRLLLWDCYRPTSVQLDLWKLVPDPRYVAKPKFSADGKPVSGSRHSRGAAVDISLAALDGTPVSMPTDHDDFSAAASPKRAFASKTGGAEAKRLSTAMTDAGFSIMPTEWWHFDDPDSAQYPFSDEPLAPR